MGRPQGDPPLAKSERNRWLIQGDYVPDMLTSVRGAWAKVVRAEILRREYHWVEEERPHRVTHHLERITRVFEDADVFLAEIGEE
jgi:hypothetical protein